jgi:hypothetical protein
MEVAREHVTRVDVALARLTVTLRPPRIIMATAGVLVGMRAPRIVAWTTAKLARIVILIAMSDLRLSPVVIAIALVSTVAASTTVVGSIPLVLAGVIIARVEIKHAGLSRTCRPLHSRLNGRAV